MGTLYYGDNLDVLKRYIADACVDLDCLAPINSAQNCNAFIKEKDGTAAANQIEAFADTWEWTQESERAYNELIVHLAAHHPRFKGTALGERRLSKRNSSFIMNRRAQGDCCSQGSRSPRGR